VDPLGLAGPQTGQRIEATSLGRDVRQQTWNAQSSSEGGTGNAQSGSEGSTGPTSGLTSSMADECIVPVSAEVADLVAELTWRCRPRIVGLLLDHRQELQLDLGEFWSKGSANHSSGSCQVCTQFMGKSGCQLGRDCGFCHIPHVEQWAARPNASRRRMLKSFSDRIGGLLLGGVHASDDTFRQAIQTFAGRHLCFQELLRENEASLRAASAAPPYGSVLSI